MSMSILQLKRIVTILVLAGGVLSCVSTAPVTEPVLERTGTNMIRYSGPELVVGISYTFATNNLGEPWLALEVSMTGALGRATEVRRENIFVRTPSGERVALMGQKEFSSVFSEVQSIAHRAEVASEPLRYMKADRRSSALPFHVTPGMKMDGGTAAMDVLHINSRHYYTGTIYFPIRGGVQAGPWVFGIDLKESQVRIPFILGAQQE
jgi:hypothetical protein